MHIAAIDVEGFGHFAHRARIDLGPGLIVVHGPNEAGKSTLRAFVRWALFGSARGERDRWTNPYGHLAGALALADDRRRVRVERRDRAVSVHADGGVIRGDDGLITVLRGTDRALFDAVFAFDLFDLQHLEALKGERVQHLLALGATLGGGAHPANLLRALDDEASAYWRPRKKDVAIRRAKRDLADLDRALREATVRAESYEVKAAHLAQTDADLRALAAHLERVEVDLGRYRRVRDAWPTWSRRLALAADLEPLLAEPALTDADKARLDQTLHALEQAAAGQRDAHERTHVARIALDQVDVDERLLAQRGAVEALLAERDDALAARVQLEPLSQTTAVAAAHAQRRLEDLGEGFSEVRLAGVPLDAAARAEARRHVVETAPLLIAAPQALAAATADHAAATADRDAARRELDALAPTPLDAEETALRALLAEAPGHSERRAEVERLEGLLAGHDAQIARAVAALADPRFARLAPRDVSDADVSAAQDWAQRWRDAESERARRLVAAEEHRAARDRELAQAQSDAALADSLPGADAPSRELLARLEAEWPDVRAAFARAAAEDQRQDELARSRAAALTAVGDALDSAQLARVDRSATADARRRSAFEALAAARRAEDAARARVAAATRRSDADPIDPSAVASAQARRDQTLKAKGALDTLQAAQAGTGGAPPRAGERLPQWLGVALLIALGVVAAVLAQLILAAAAVACGLIVAVVALARSRGATRAAAPDVGPAQRAFVAALKAAGLAEAANRSDIEVALAARDDELKRVQRAIERQAEAAEAARLRSEAEAALGEASRTVRATQEALAEALRSTGLPVDADRELAAALVGAAEEVARTDAALAASSHARAAAGQRVTAFTRDLGRLVAAEPVTVAACEAALVRLREARRAADAREERLREAEAGLVVARRAEGAARDAVAACEASPRVPSELAAGWRAWADALGIEAAAPSPECAAAVATAARLTAARRARDDARAARDAAAPSVAAFNAELTRLAGVAGVDASVGELQVAADQLTERRARRVERQRQLPVLEERARQAAAAAAAAEERAREAAGALAAFEAWAAGVEAPEGLEPASAEAWVDALAAAREAVAARDAAAARLQAAREAVQGFVARAAELAAALGADPGSAPASIDAALAYVGERGEAVEEAAAERVKRRERRAALAQAVALVEARAAEHAAAVAAWRDAAAAVGCVDGADWSARLARSAERDRLETELAQVEAELRGSLGAAFGEPDSVERRALAAGDVAAWEARVSELVEGRERLGERREELEATRGELRVELKTLESSTEIAELGLKREAAKARLEAARREWWRLSIATRLLRDTFERFRRERQPAVLKRASAWFVEATGGGYTGVEVDESSGLAFDAIAADGTRHAADALSTGTTGLLYLCLRLALAVDQAEQVAPLPVLLDDVLAHFDPERARGAARVLARVAEEASGLQLVLFTCRPETVRCAREASADVTVVELPRWAGEQAPRPRLNGAGSSASRGGSAPSGPTPPRSAAASPSPGDAELDALVDDALAYLVDRDEPLARADFVEHLGLDDSGWRALRVALEEHDDVDVEGERRGRRYLFSG